MAEIYKAFNVALTTFDTKQLFIIEIVKVRCLFLPSDSEIGISDVHSHLIVLNLLTALF